jgi:hypothetical protein
VRPGLAGAFCLPQRQSGITLLLDCAHGHLFFHRHRVIHPQRVVLVKNARGALDQHIAQHAAANGGKQGQNGHAQPVKALAHAQQIAGEGE